ncbi:TadE/TadG family type IV pilus assembly protein [Pararhodobacter oceanensis]|uniref:Uncharacterized protein n=1 Tax=Pararhodobacter oceanensis TaxID=2172121 RepID=A0A2T8HY13_9RHOB|nr:hypothetical protein [Pararhodobacter oceanensis]PVH30316.1 hypothetical protein DDE20_01810 [Pararhodobacter oceanensis]
MTAQPADKPHCLRRLWRGTEGSVSVETIIVVPLLCWALAASVVFYDGFSTRYHAQMAAQTVADIMSRETDLFTEDYVDGMNDVFDYLVDSRMPTRIRVSSVIWDSVNERNMLQWSYGTHDLSALPASTFELLQAGDLETLTTLFGEETGFTFAGATTQLPVADFAERIPQVLPGEALLVVETFALWTPFANVGLGQIRFNPVVVVRPRFAPWVNFEGIETVYPEDGYEVVWTNDDDDDDPQPEPDPEPEPDTVTSFDFDNGVTTGWTHDTTTGNSAMGGRFLGPFGNETYDRPVQLLIDAGGARRTVTIAFDLLILDSWDGFQPQWSDARGDTLTIMIDGEPISLDAFDVGVSGFYRNARYARGTVGSARYRMRMTPTRLGSSFYGASHHDQVWRVEIQVENAPETFNLGLSAGTDESVSNEGFGIDNLDYGSAPLRDNFTPVPSRPQPYDHDAHTRFARYEGCPVTDDAAPWFTIDNDDLGYGYNNALTFERIAGGTTAINRCNLFHSYPSGFISAEPQFIIRYDNQGRSGSSRQLQIRMDDDNNGYTCDTVLVVRGPDGLYIYNDDRRNRYGWIGQSDWNATLRLGNAQSGEYAVWIGTYNGRSCRSRVHIYRY